jgi:hypothetical protein
MRLRDPHHPASQVGFILFTLLGLATVPTPLPAVVFGCPADLDHSGRVDGLDLGLLLAAWGTGDPTADFDGDGTVGCFDRAYLFGHWGPCVLNPTDLNGDGIVNGIDLGMALGAYGTDCRTDLNQDGDIDQDDTEALLCWWDEGSLQGDLQGDGAVDGVDLGLVLGAHGTDCHADLNGDGWIGHPDVEIILRDWGK